MPALPDRIGAEEHRDEVQFLSSEEFAFYWEVKGSATTFEIEAWTGYREVQGRRKLVLPEPSCPLLDFPEGL